MEFLHLRPPSHCRIHSPSLSLPDQPDQQHTRFPTSSDRLARPAASIHQPPFDRSARYDPLGRFSQDKHSLARKVLCSSFAPRFFPGSVARGVLSDGTWTTKHPCVPAFLQSPYSRPSLTSKTSAAIYSLAALHVFYSPSHLSYDVFWHPDIKESTAIFVHGVVTMEPSPISTTPMTWLGVHDMLWQLTGIQKEYAKSQGGKTTTPPPAPTRRSLRKRKPVQALLQALEEREPSEVPEPPRKKARKSKSDENEKGAEATSLVAEQPAVSAENEAGPSALSTTLSSPLEARGTADTTPSPLTVTSSLPSDSQPTAKDDVGSSRGHSKDTASKKASAPQTASRTSRRTRERSPSFSSGSSTAVSAAGSTSKRARSSSSVSSTSTTVGAETGGKGKGKGKEKAADVAEATEEEETDDEAGKRSTRSKRPATKEAAPKSSRKKSGGTTTKRSPDDIAAAEAPRRVRKRTRVTSSRSRKARKS
ncbi:hypothetical protein EDB84DRAFT_570888 [Lactarius hengduanensis]|nr:hypothetical protein EDB84DRAFT_570888 [Lactarius hengduanensis]